MSNQNINVFVSYSHTDSALVTPVVRLLRVNKSLIFQDIDGIVPGKKWRDEITKALSEAKLVILFWCHHSSQSNEVYKEWKTAIEQTKDILPLLLDETPLPPELAEFQWIDFRGVVGDKHNLNNSSSNIKNLPTPLTKENTPYNPISTILMVILFLTIVTSSIYIWDSSSSIGINVESPPPPYTEQPTDNKISNLAMILPLITGVFIITIALISLFWQLTLKKKQQTKEANIYSNEVEKNIAAILEVEIFRRITQ